MQNELVSIRSHLVVSEEKSEGSEVAKLVSFSALRTSLWLRGQSVAGRLVSEPWLRKLQRPV